jgi:hypothetical protein
VSNNTSTAIQAIETLYNQNRFRSRLEARWAVFMDCLQIKYQYEPEGYQADGVRYLPDFYLPDLGCFMEVKPTPEHFGEYERRKAKMLSDGTGKPLYVFAGECAPITIPESLGASDPITTINGAYAFGAGQHTFEIYRRHCFSYCSDCKIPLIASLDTTPRFACPHCQEILRGGFVAPQILAAFAIARMVRLENPVNVAHLLEAYKETVRTGRFVVLFEGFERFCGVAKDELGK